MSPFNLETKHGMNFDNVVVLKVQFQLRQLIFNLNLIQFLTFGLCLIHNPNIMKNQETEKQYSFILA